MLYQVLDYIIEDTSFFSPYKPGRNLFKIPNHAYINKGKETEVHRFRYLNFETFCFSSFVNNPDAESEESEKNERNH